jgi:hypothetical protein
VDLSVIVCPDDVAVSDSIRECPTWHGDSETSFESNEKPRWMRLCAVSHCVVFEELSGAPWETISELSVPAV